MKHLRSWVGRHPVAALAVLGLSVVAIISAADAWAAPPGQPISEIEQQLVNAVNAERKKVGAPPLIVNYSLMEAAYKHTEHQSKIRSICHEGCGDGTVRSRIDATGYKWVTYGENVAMGQPNVSAVMTAWMNSAGHRRNILNKDYRDIGVGHVRSNTSYWTQVFGVPKSPPEYVTVTPPAGANRPCELSGDFDFDGRITRGDISQVAARFMVREGDSRWDVRYDLVADGVINVFDVGELANRLGDACPPTP